MSYEKLNELQNESDTDQGFIPSKIIIKQQKQTLFKNTTPSIVASKQFIPRYFLEGIMRKQPSLCYKRFSHFDLINQEVKSLEENKYSLQNYKDMEDIEEKVKIREKFLTPYDKYVLSGDFIQVYSRYKDFSFVKDQQNFAKYQVKLDCLRSIEDVTYKQVKPFEMIDQKIQEVSTQTTKNGTIRQTLLQFDSKFQCGNLLCAYKHKKQAYTYTLFIQNDTNTNGYNQWFYFSIRGGQVGIKYKLQIVNFRKRHSFFKLGNKPITFCLSSSKNPNQSGYSKSIQDIIYNRSPIIKSPQSKQKFFQLSFSLSIPNENDIVYISAGLPYSYSKLLNNLGQYGNVAQKNGINWVMDSIGCTIAGNQVPYVTITKRQIEADRTLPTISKNRPKDVNQVNQENQNNRNQSSETSVNTKKIIWLMARQHPGETWSSYLMDQFLYCLVHQTSQQSKYLLQNFVIKCVPMINIDGVICGNFRCDLSGTDLNRNWKMPSSILHPQIYSIKNEIQSLTNQGQIIQSCLDLHGHSKQYNVFCYSCKTDNYQCRLLPYLFSQINQQFHFPFCTFGISRYKQSTARAVIFSIIKNTNVLTIQSSFFGSKINGKLKIFQPKAFQNMAHTLIKGYARYFSQDQHYKACKQIIRLRMTQFLAFKDQSQNVISGSDSQPSGDQIQINQKFENILPKNLIKQCIQMQKSKKITKRPRNLKRQTFQAVQNKSYKVKKISYNSQNKNRTIDIIKSQSPAANDTKINWQKIKTRKTIQPKTGTHFKKKSVQLAHQTLDEGSRIQSNKKMLIKDFLDRDEQKLPYFPRQKPQMIPLKLKNESFQIFKDAYHATQKQIKHNDTSLQDIRNYRRNTSKKLGIFKQKGQKQQQFPLLCVLSQNKKRTHVQKYLQNKQRSKHQSQRSQLPQKTKTAIQTRTQAIKQLRDKNKNSMELVSKIWRENFTRYGMAFSTFKISK